MSKELKIGLCGLGRIGKKHAEKLAWKTRFCKVIAVCSPVKEEINWAAQELYETTHYTSLEEMLKNPEIDAVILATPTTLHPDQAIMVLQAGKHLFMEKPLGLSVEECERVEAVAAKHPKQMAMIGFMRRFDPSYAKTYEYIQQGKIGKPFMFYSQTCDMTDPSGFFVKFSPTSGGIFMDCSVHDIDLARWYLNATTATKVYASGVNAMFPELAKHNDVDNGMAIIEFSNNTRAMIFASRLWTFGHETGSEIIGDKGKLRIGLGEDAACDRIQIGDAQGLRKLAVLDFYERFSEAFQNEMQAFVNSCLSGKPAGVKLADATAITRIGLAITKAFRAGQAVTL